MDRVQNLFKELWLWVMEQYYDGVGWVQTVHSIVSCKILQMNVSNIILPHLSMKFIGTDSNFLLFFTLFISVL